MSRHIVIPGGSGQVGTILARAFTRRGDQVTVLSRRPEPAAWATEPWDGASLGSWAKAVDGADVVINLAGRSVNCRYNTRNRRDILESRLDSTRAVGQAIAAAARPPRLWLQASTATIYSHRFDAPNDEETGKIGSTPGTPASWQMSVEVARAWEAELERAATPATRKVALRAAMVMSPDPGGILDTMLGLVRRGLGGTAGSGAQFVSWVHEEDFVDAIFWLIDHDDLAGPINIAAPQPLPNRDFMRALRQAAGVKIGLPATRFMLEIGAIFLRTETELLLKSRRVVSKRLADSGFQFKFPSWPEAAAELVARARAEQV